MKFFILLLLMFSRLALAGANAVTPENPASPPVKCEVRHAASCILEGATITVQPTRDDTNVHVWQLKGQLSPRSTLVVMAPPGCEAGRSDALGMLRFEHGFAWSGGHWDRLVVRLKRDGSCDMTILMPPFDNDPLEWAFTTGLDLIRACETATCSGRRVGDLKPQFVQRFRETQFPVARPR